MTTLAAKTEARIALQWRKLSERAQLIRGRVEATPGAGMEPVIKIAEQHIANRFHDKAEEALVRVVDGLEAFAEKEAVRLAKESAQEQDDHLATTGVDTHRTATGVGRRHGMLWLIDKGRLQGQRRRAAEAWAADYTLANGDSLRSCLNDNARGGEGASQDVIEKRALARYRLSRAHDHVLASTGSLRLAGLLDAVCGRGDTLRGMAGGDKDRALVMEAEMMVALDIAGVSYGILRIAA